MSSSMIYGRGAVLAFDFDLKREGSENGLIFDSVTHPSCREWTVAHVDAVLGDRISPLAWTVVGPAFELSQARLWASLGVVPATRDRRVRFSARLDGRLHVGLSTLRAAAMRIPGVDPTRTETELGLLPSGTSRTVTDRLWYPLAIVGGLGVALRGPWWTYRQRRSVRRAVALPPVSDLDAAALIDRVEMLRRELVPVLRTHALLRMGTHASLGRLRAGCADDDLAFGLLADLPGLEASQPSLALLAMAGRARGGAVDEADLDAFIDRFGHRGVNELDPTVPVWESQRLHLRTIVERMIANDHEDPVQQARDTHRRARSGLNRIPRSRRQRIAADAAFARRFSVLGERSKSDVSRLVNQIRRSLDALARRNPQQCDPTDAPMLSWEELRALSMGTAAFDADLPARRHDLYGPGQQSGEPTERPVRTLHGVAASPGAASGSAVVVHDPTDDVADGQVLVAHATDTAWTPLFIGMVAVVTDTGGVLSHSSIVARDLGIPAVVGTGNATATIRTGDRTHVDGDHGRVHLLM